MALESGTYISDLNPSNPVGATDKVSTLDDHIRLIKATLQTTFPGIAGEVSATHTELNFLDGVTGTTGTGKLVLDDTPTIADLTVTDSITLPSASIADAALSSNVPRLNTSNTFTASSTGDSSAVAISAGAPGVTFIQTTGGEDGKIWQALVFSGTYRLRTRTDAGDIGADALVITRSGTAIDEIELNATTLDFNGNADISGTLAVGGLQTIAYGDPSIQLVETDAGVNEKAWWIRAQGGGLLIQGRVDNGSASGATNIVAITRNTGATSAAEIELNADLLDFNGALDLSGNLTVGGAVTVNGAVRAGTAATSTSSTLAAGQIHHRSANTTVPSMSAGQWVAVQNTGTSAITLSEGSGVTLELGGTTTTGNRTLGPKGFAFIYFRANNVGTVHGSGVS